MDIETKGNEWDFRSEETEKYRNILKRNKKKQHAVRGEKIRQMEVDTRKPRTSEAIRGL